MENNKVDHFAIAIQEYLQKAADEDPLFAITLQKPGKTIEGCCNYITKCVQEIGRAGFEDEEVYGWARHYYDEDDIADPGSINCKVIVNKRIELTPEEIKAARKRFADELIQKEKEKLILEKSNDIVLNDEDLEAARKLALQKAVVNEEKRLKDKAAKPAKKAEKTETVQVQASLF